MAYQRLEIWERCKRKRAFSINTWFSRRKKSTKTSIHGNMLSCTSLLTNSTKSGVKKKHTNTSMVAQVCDLQSLFQENFFKHYFSNFISLIIEANSVESLILTWSVVLNILNEMRINRKMSFLYNIHTNFYLRHQCQIPNNFSFYSIEALFLYISWTMNWPKIGINFFQFQYYVLWKNSKAFNFFKNLISNQMKCITFIQTPFSICVLC